MTLKISEKRILLKDIYDFEKQKESLEKRVKTYVKDKSFPLEERWQVFIESDFGSIECYYQTYGKLGNHNFCYHDTFYMEKYQTVYNCELVQRISEQFLPECSEFDEDDERVLTKEELNEIKEEILQEFHKGFIFDW